MAITFQIEDVHFRLEGRNQLKVWIRKVIRKNGFREGDINYLFTSDLRVHKLNVEFLDHDTFTDIITFDETEGARLSGDIVISVDRVRENAQTFGVSFEEELRRVMIHGVLHLCGFKDKTAAEKKTMRGKEEEALSLFPRIR